jgi:spermidine synthase
MIIGYGSGVSVGAATAIPELQDIDCIEIEPAVVQAGPAFDFVNRKSYVNPKVHIMYDDARNYMNVTRKQYDIIISEPSNPWIAGVANLFTAEFYDRAAKVLRPDGVFVQWVQLYELDPDDLRMILAEFQRKFPEVSVWNTGIGDLILVGTRQPQHLDLARVAKIVHGDPSIANDFREYLKISEPEGILAYYVFSTDEARKFSAKALRNTDDHPLLEFHAPRQLFDDTRDLNVELLYGSKAGIIPPGTDLNDPELTYGAMVEPMLAIKRPNLANQAMGLLAQVERRDPSTLHVAIARIDLDSGNLTSAEEALRKASETQTPESPVYSETQELWGNLYEKSAGQTEAIQHYENAVGADPARAGLYKKLAQLNAQKQNWNEAARWMKQYVDMHPRDIGEAWAFVGDYRLAGKQAEEAIEALKTSLLVDPYTYWARWRMARLFEERKQSGPAIEQYEFLMKYAFDRDPDVYMRLARLYLSAGRVADARRVMTKGKRMFATNAEMYRLYKDISNRK